MSRLWTNAAECDYKDFDRELTKQFMHVLAVEGMISEILRQVLLWALLNNMKEAKELDSVRHGTKNMTMRPMESRTK